MNLTSRCKNIHIDNNDNEEEEEEEEEYEEDDDDDEEEMNDDFEEDEENVDDVTDDEEDEDDEEEAQMDDEEEEDEPDFMDNSGKCWEFASKIRNEKHLKEWCQNKMGKMIVGKEEKLTRQFHCQIKECQFKAIFLNACSNIYTRNKHNHQMKNAKNILKSEERTNSPSTHDYVDCYGKLWNFHSYIGKNISPEKMLNKYSLSGIIKYQKTLNFKCQKNNHEGGRCKFAGIYLKSNGCLYTRGKHGHEHIEKNPKPSIGDDFVDNYGKLWSFHAHIDKNISQDKLLRKFGFSHITKKQKCLNFHCRKINPAGGECQFVGIYLKSNGCLYTRGEHEHTKRGKTPQNIGDNYVDIFGKIWKFNKEIGKDIQHEELSNKFGFGLIQAIVKGLNLYCVRKGPTGKCKFNGVYLNSNGCLYTRGKHNHAHIEKNPKPNIGDNYVDRYNRLWNFRANIGKDISKDKLLTEFGFTNIKRNEKTLNLFCQKINFTGNKKCPMKGIYLKSNGCLYTRGEHVHEIRERTPQNNGEDYVDHLGNVWSFHSKIGKNVPNGIWLSKFGFSSIKYNQSTLYLYCQRQKTNGEKCPFKGIYLDSNGCLYIRGKHEHK